MKYISTAEAAVKWEISQRRVVRLASDGRIAGATLVGNSWVIPENAEKPADGRTKRKTAEPTGDCFRFPLFMNRAENEFNPPLSGEEMALRRAQLDFLACDFPKAEKELIPLADKAGNLYVRQTASFFLCWLSATVNNGKEYDEYFARLQKSLAGDFPHRQEMQFLLPWLSACLTQYKKTAQEFVLDTGYVYASSVYPLMAYLSFINRNVVQMPEAIDVQADLFEVEVRQLEENGHIFEAQLLHLCLFLTYFVKANEPAAIVHLRKAIDAAKQFGFIFSVADASPFYKTVYDKVLADYPQDFADKIKRCGQQMGKSFAEFAKDHAVTDIFSSISNTDVQYVLFALQGYTYKQVAYMLRLSAHTVAMRYSAIFEKMNVANKKELCRLLLDADVQSVLGTLF